jgi:hypothetical protein
MQGSECIATDHKAQRMRLIKGESITDAEKQARKLENLWQAELKDFLNDAANYYDEVDQKKKDALEKTIRFPIPPNALKRPTFSPEFNQTFSFGKYNDKVHVSDYNAFLKTIESADEFRIRTRMVANVKNPPALEQIFLGFPQNIAPIDYLPEPQLDLTQRIELKWHDYLCPWRWSKISEGAKNIGLKSNWLRIEKRILQLLMLGLINCARTGNSIGSIKNLFMIRHTPSGKNLFDIFKKI